MDQIGKGILRQVATLVTKTAVPRPSGQFTAQAPTHRRSFSTTGVTPPEGKAARASAPETVKKALSDILKIDPQAPRDERTARFNEVGERHLDRLEQSADTHTGTGRDEFLAGNLTTALFHVPKVLAKWVGGPSGLAPDSKAHESHVHDRRLAFSNLRENNERSAAAYASMVPPGLRDKYGIQMSSSKMASLGVADKGPYLNENELMVLCDYAHHEGDMFNSKRALDVLAQQLGPTGLAIKAHLGTELGLFGSALDKLAQNPSCSVKGDFTKGVLLGRYQEKGLTLLCQSGKPYPVEIATSAALNPKDSYINRPGYNAEVLFRQAPGVDISPYHSVETLGESEVLVLARTPLLGAGTQQVSTLDPQLGGVKVEHTQYVFEAAPGAPGKGST